MLERELSDKLKKIIRKYPVVALTGPRQSGKTTLLRHLFRKRVYVSLEEPDTRQFAMEDPRAFLAQGKRGLVIDEVQRVPQLMSYMQTLVDASPKPGRFIVSGSNNLLLMKEVSQSLSGRVAILKLLPLSLNELLSSKHASRNVNSYLHRGFYPRIYDRKLPPHEWLQNYTETYVEKDLRDFIQVSDLSRFRQLLTLLASACGQLLNLSNLSNTLGLSHNTVKAWITALEASYLVFRLPPYHKNFKKRLVKTPKIYFYDTGLVCSLLKIKTEAQLAGHYVRGSLFENMVIADRIKQRLNRGENPEFFFWRDHTGNEVDLLWEEGEGVRLMEVKAAQTIHSQFFEGFEAFRKDALVKVKSATLVYGGSKKQVRSKANVVPWAEASERGK